MASRWAYEGLAVTQFMENAYERQFYEEDQRMRTANWRKDLWLRELRNVVSGIRQGTRERASPPAGRSGLCFTRSSSGRPNGSRGSTAHLLPEGPWQCGPGGVARSGCLPGPPRPALQEHLSGAERAKEDRVQSLTATPALKRAYFTSWTPNGTKASRSSSRTRTT